VRAQDDGTDESEDSMRSALVLALIGIAGVSFGQNAPEPPKITGIDHVMFYTTAPDGVARLYHGWLGLTGAVPAEPGEVLRYAVGKQWLGYRKAPDAQAVDRMDHVAFATDDLESLKGYLAKRGVLALKAIERQPDGSRSFRVKDPEGHTIEFVERAKNASSEKPDAEAVSGRLIHAGFIVRDRATEDAFYRDILGFHVYWYGGSEPGRTDWCAMQVPDGTDWLEYMLNSPAQPTARQLGGMNHISLGVENVQQAAAKLESHGWQPQTDQQPKIGRDGKWQLNLRDPDLSRVELMEFRPAEKPCCSEFQGLHPGPDR
jgi:catechol 2,3-dioxygenase-like lactoylglutathione lyase family enzyme